MENFKKIKVRYTNVYLIEGREGWLMVDTGPRTDVNYIGERLKNIGVSLEEVMFLLITHHHHDHVGNLAAMMRLLPDARLIVHKSEVGYIKDGKMKMPKGRNWCLKLAVKLSVFLNFSYEPYVPNEKDIILDANGLDLKEWGFDWQVVHTPGHTIGSLSLVSERDAIVGDLVMDRKDWCRSSPLPAFLENMLEVKQSLRKLIDRGVENFWPSHGNRLKTEGIMSHFKLQ